MKRILKVILLALLILVSCTNDVSDPDDIALDSWEGIFQQYWSVMNSEYVQFSYDDIDWDETYSTYLPLFQELDWEKEEDSLKAFRLFKEISKDLIDYHYLVQVSDNFGNFLWFSPSYEKKYAEAVSGSIMDYPDIYLYQGDGQPYSLVSINEPNKSTSENYLDYVEGYTEIADMGTNFHNSPSHPFRETMEGEIPINYSDSKEWKKFISLLEMTYDFNFFFGITEDNVAYLHFSWFAFSSEYLNPEYMETITNLLNLSKDEKNTVNETIKKFNEALKAILSITTTNHYNGNEIQGIVLDFRNNVGGYHSLTQAFNGLFFKDCNGLFGYGRYKNGYSRYDYTPYVEMRTNRFFDTLAAPEKDYERPVALLTNGFSISASELSSIALKDLPNSHIFGTNTFGATCSLASREFFHSGPYTSSKLYVYATTIQFVDKNYKSYEGIGIAPDTIVKPNKNNDDCFEKAVSWVLGE